VSRYKVIGRIVYHLQFLEDESLEHVLSDLRTQIAEGSLKSTVAVQKEQSVAFESDDESQGFSEESIVSELEEAEHAGFAVDLHDDDHDFNEEAFSNDEDDLSDYAFGFTNEPEEETLDEEVEAAILAEAESILMNALHEETDDRELIEESDLDDVLSEEEIYGEDPTNDPSVPADAEQDSDLEDGLTQTDNDTHLEAVAEEEDDIESSDVHFVETDESTANDTPAEMAFAHSTENHYLDTEYLDAEELSFQEELSFESNYEAYVIEEQNDEIEAAEVDTSLSSDPNAVITSLYDYDPNEPSLQSLEDDTSSANASKIEAPRLEIKSLDELDELHMELSDLDDDLFFDLTSDT